MKLVELLAKELAEWPENVVVYFQWGNGEVFATSKGFPTEYNDGVWYVVGSDIEMAYNAPMYDKKLDLADDHDTANVNRAQWQAERDRQNGGEWKRHRGGKCPVKAGTQVSTKHRDGEVVEVHHHTAQTGSSVASLNGIWKHNGDSFDIMQYRVISQPQAEEVEVNTFVGKDAQLEYAFSQDGVALENLDWKPIGGKLTSIEGVDPAIFGEVEDSDIDTSQVMRTLNELSAKWDQVESPFKWRDTVNELNAYIEKFTRERDELIERLASEGFALIPPVVTTWSYILPFEDWEVGDLVTSKTDYNKLFTKGKQYKITRIYEEYGTNRISIESDDKGADNGWIASNFEFHSRP